MRRIILSNVKLNMDHLSEKKVLPLSIQPEACGPCGQILSDQGLELHPQHDNDPLDDLSDDFDPVGVINGYFPDGVHISIQYVIMC